MGELKAFSLERRKNIILRSIGELDISSGQLTAYHSTLDLKPGLLAINSNFSKNFKNNLNWERNRALKQRITFAVETHDLAISEFHNLLAKQCLRYHKMLFHPLGLFQEFINLKIAKIYTARSNGTLIGGIYVLFDSNTAYYGWGARDTNNSLGVHTLLINMLIENSIMLEMHEVDFGLTAINDKNLLQYKLKWGVNTNSVFTYSTANSSPIVNLQNGFLISRNIYSRLPLTLAKIITPKILRTLIH